MKVVTKGLFQTFGIDYDDIFSPIVKYYSTWSVLAIVDVENFYIIQFDITIIYSDRNINQKDDMINKMK
jgi:hypothetical protein